MQLIRHLPSQSDRPTAVAIGNFDGLHLGHQAVIAAMRDAAVAQNLIPSVLTFEPHPRHFFARDHAPFRLERLSDKLARLAQAGVARVYAPRFNTAFASITADSFLNDILLNKLGARVVVTGENFAFGHKRGGDIAMLKAWGAVHNVRIITVPPVLVEGAVSSSSAVRAAISAGNMARAETLLGRPYSIKGRVVHGDGRGRTIGFPTANIALTPHMLLPQKGVYAVKIKVSGAELMGVANLGIRPTIGVDTAPKLEVHVFDTMQDFYGKTFEVLFVHKVRDEKKFDSMENLKAQIANDCNDARIQLGITA